MRHIIDKRSLHSLKRLLVYLIIIKIIISKQKNHSLYLSNIMKYGVKKPLPLSNTAHNRSMVLGLMDIRCGKIKTSCRIVHKIEKKYHLIAGHGYFHMVEHAAKKYHGGKDKKLIKYYAFHHCSGVWPDLRIYTISKQKKNGHVYPGISAEQVVPKGEFTAIYRDLMKEYFKYMPYGEYLKQRRIILAKK